MNNLVKWFSRSRFLKIFAYKFLYKNLTPIDKLNFLYVMKVYKGGAYSHFSNYLPFNQGMALHLNGDALCQVLLKLA